MERSQFAYLENLVILTADMLRREEDVQDNYGAYGLWWRAHVRNMSVDKLYHEFEGIVKMMDNGTIGELYAMGRLSDSRLVSIASRKILSHASEEQDNNVGRLLQEYQYTLDSYPTNADSELMHNLSCSTETDLDSTLSVDEDASFIDESFSEFREERGREE